MSPTPPSGHGKSSPNITLPHTTLYPSRSIWHRSPSRPRTRSSGHVFVRSIPLPRADLCAGSHSLIGAFTTFIFASTTENACTVVRYSTVPRVIIVKEPIYSDLIDCKITTPFETAVTLEPTFFASRQRNACSVPLHSLGATTPYTRAFFKFRLFLASSHASHIIHTQPAGLACGQRRNGSGGQSPI